MKNKSVFRRHVVLAAVLPIFISLLTGAYAADAKKKGWPDLPQYETEEIAAPALWKLAQEKAGEAGIGLDAAIPEVPKIVGKYIGIGLQGRVSGTAEQVMKFLSSLENRDQFRLVPELDIYVDRKDSSLVRASFHLMSWYATTEKAARKSKKWVAAVEPAAPAMEIFASCVAPLEKNAFSVVLIPPAGEAKKPDLPVRLTNFDFTGKTVRISGEGQNSSVSNKFGGMLFKNESLKAYEWVWESRPKYNSKRKDGTVQFSILSKLIEKSSEKKAKRKKS